MMLLVRKLDMILSSLMISRSFIGYLSCPHLLISAAWPDRKDSKRNPSVLDN